MLVGLAVFAPILAGIVRGAYSIGVQVGVGKLAVLLELVTWYLPIVVTMNVLVGLLQSDGAILNFGAEKLHLTAVPNRSLALGLLAVDIQAWLVAMVAPAALVVAGYAAGVGSATVTVVATTAVVVLLVAAILWGYVIGLAGRILWRRLIEVNVPESLLHVVGVLGLGLTFGVGGLFAGSLAAKFEDGLSIAAIVPDGQPPTVIGPYAELLFFGTPVLDSLSTAAVLNAAGVVASIPVGIGCVTLIAPRLWYGASTPRNVDETGSPDDDEQTAPTVHSPSRDWPWLKYPIGFVADGVVRRTFRTPQRLLHLSYYVLLLGVFVASALTAPALLFPLMGTSAVLFGIWIAGGAVGLNPIGEEGTMLGQIVLSEYPARTFVRARIVAGTAVGLPFVLLGALFFAVGGYPAVNIAAGVTFLSFLLPVSAAIAVGIGSSLPKSGPGTDRGSPEILAVVLHAGVSGVLTVSGGGLTSGLWYFPQSSIGAAAVGLLGVFVADLCYRFAVAALEGYGRISRPGRLYTIELVIGICLFAAILSITIPMGAEILFDIQVSTPVRVVLGVIVWLVTGGLYLHVTDRI